MIRRDFLRTSALMGGALGLGGFGDPGSGGRPSPPAQDAKRILILGGTGFIGPHMVRYARARGHELTLFNRGRTNPHLFPDLEKLVGNRDGDLTALEGRTWDAVIDNSGYTPQQVGATARLLQGAVGQYVFTSTRAVYTDFTPEHMDEGAPLGMKGVPPEQWEGYGPLKVLSEWKVQNYFPDRSAILRPVVIVGPGDRSDRFTYWVVRVDRGGEVLSAGKPTEAIQYIDVRDLAEFFIRVVENGTTGVYNVAGPEARLNWAEMLSGIRAVTSTPVSFTWVDVDFLIEHGVRPYEELPMYRPPRGEWTNVFHQDISRALAKGLTFRPLAVTAKETLDWFKSLPAERQATLRTGCPPELEAEVLDAWHARGRG